MASSNTPELTLSECFKKGMDLMKKIENCDESSTSASYQERMKTAVEHFLLSQNKISMVNLFSRNEDLEEVHTNELKYFLVSAFLADLTSKLQTDRSNRLDNIKLTMEYATDYLKLCKNYTIGHFTLINKTLQSLKDGNSDNISLKKDHKDISDQRQAKIEKYKKEMEITHKLESMKNILDDENCDDETLRDFWITLIGKWILTTVDLILSLQQEKDMLQEMEKLNKGDLVLPQNAPPKKPMQTFILTRDAAQAKVFGAGYPSLPTMTVEEYADLEMQSLAKRMNNQNIQETSTNSDEEDESDEKVYKKREFDDWKDTHRRGEGNRMNMG